MVCATCVPSGHQNLFISHCINQLEVLPIVEGDLSAIAA
jgi:hypothetical protein